MSLRACYSLKRAGTRSSALVLTLSILVLITAISLTFFSQSKISRQISFSSAGQYRADAVARAALDTITGDLRTEVIAGSQAEITNGATLYLPTTNALVTNTTVAPSRIDAQGFANLVKQSAGGSNFWAGANYAGTIANPIRAVAGNSTQTPSLNGRYIKINRWNKPGLLGDPGLGASPQIPAGYLPPDWIVLTRQGAITNAAAMPSVAVLADKTTTNLDYAVGRFAYTIYNEGGLLDANVAGFPSSLSGSTFSTERGMLPQVDLGAIPGVTNANGLVQWRNPATMASYTNSILTSTNGFTTVSKGNQAFVSRQDLINYVQANSSQIQSSAMQYLGTSTRDSDGPSYYPNPGRPKAVPPRASADDVLNPNVLTIRAQTGFPRADQTSAVVGEPLLKHRFPLSRLALLQNPTGGNVALIKKYFAMQYNSSAGLWDYVDPDGSGSPATTVPTTIKTLDLVAKANREPTFWELLQAGILTGSLGATKGAYNAFPTTQDANPIRQIFAIGLSIIDQYDTDDTPTVLNFGGEMPANTNDLFIAGVENLPYISSMFQQHFRDNFNVVAPATSSIIDGYMLFSLWNPHRNVAAATPGTFRIRVNGQTEILVQSGDGGYTKVSGAINHGILGTISNSDTFLVFQTTATRSFDKTDGLRPADALLGQTSAEAQFPNPSVPGVSTLQVGILMGQVVAPKAPEFASPLTGHSDNGLQNLYPKGGITITLEKSVGSNWIPYQSFPGYNFSENNNGTEFVNVTADMNASLNGFGPALSPPLPPLPPAAVIAVTHSDPRTSRFGFAFQGGGVTPSMLANHFNLVSPAGTGFAFLQALTANGVSTTSVGVADYAYNPANGIHGYADPDGTVRKGDSNPTSSESAGPTHGADSPFFYGDARPVMLNRAFTSVAEMGYAFRDDPWRSLNFSSPDSADGGLLDLFCVNENDNATRAGVIDLNGASQQVLTALLMNNYQDPANPTGTPLSQSQATAIAQAIRTQLGPVNLPTVVIRNAADLPMLTDKVAKALGGIAPFEFKFSREAFVRAFADVLNARTWNLMIDVIAQSGRYGTTAKTLNDFIVEGERHYWMHIAIDRYSGQVIGTQIEPVNE